MRPKALVAGALASLFALAGCAGVAGLTTEGPDGELVIYVGRNQGHVGALVDQFEAETGVSVEARYGSTGELATTLLKEQGRSKADLFFAQDPVYIGALSAAGMLESLPQDIISRVPAGISGANDEWVGVTARRRVLVYNTAELDAGELPSSVNDLTGPRWKGRVGIAPTHSSFVSFVASMIAMEGEKETRVWLEQMAANRPELFDKNSQIVDAVAAGDLDVGLVNHYYVHQARAEQGPMPVANHSFTEGDPGDVLMPTTIGMLASSANQATALAFIRFLLSDSSQEHFLENVKEYPLVEGVGTPIDERPLNAMLIRGMKLDKVGENLSMATTLIAEAGLI